MTGYRDPPTRADRAKAIAAVVAIHAGLVALVITGPGIDEQPEQQPPTQMFDVALPPPPPPPPPPEPKPAARPDREEGAAGKKAEPTPVVAPPARIPTPSPVPAAPVAGTGSATSAGAASAGTGPGAGGSGSGRGGGGSGGIGSDVRLLGGHRAKLPSRLLRVFAADRGTAALLLTIAETGRVSECRVLQGTGSGDVDQALCDVMLRGSRWEAARDLQGRPVSVRIRYTAVWSKD